MGNGVIKAVKRIVTYFVRMACVSAGLFQSSALERCLSRNISATSFVGIGLDVPSEVSEEILTLKL